MPRRPVRRVKRKGSKALKTPDKRKGSKADLKKRTYMSWSNMLSRCYDPKHRGYREYGARGVIVYALWRPDFYEALPEDRRRKAAYAAFLAAVGVKPTWRHTLDRISAHEHYVPGNVRWEVQAIQAINKRDTHYVKHPRTGERVVASLLAQELKLSYHQLRAKMIKDGTWYALRFESVRAEKEQTNESESSNETV